MKAQRELLFRIRTDGREYSIYTNGETEGFGEDAQVFNFFPQIVRAMGTVTLYAKPVGKPHFCGERQE